MTPSSSLELQRRNREPTIPKHLKPFPTASTAYAALFGTGYADGSSNFTHWTVRDFGAEARLTAADSTTALFGTGHAADGVGIPRWPP